MDQNLDSSKQPDELKGQPEKSNHELIGKTLNDRYQVLSQIGEGGMGIVYSARHLLMDKIVAIKVLNAAYINNENALLRFQHEAKVASRLSHPNIVTIHDFGVSENVPYLVMDFVEGVTLEDILDEQTNIPYGRAIALMQQLCDALQYAHEEDLIHRDLKPGNLMIVKTRQGQDQLKVLDFGLAKFITEGAEQKLTQSGYIFGTGYYMSPEQCRGKQADVRSDIYAVGCVLYECLTGVPPFVGDNLLETFRMHIEEQQYSFSKLRPDLNLPNELELIVNRALQKDPQLRYQSAAELKEELIKLQNWGAPRSGGQQPALSAPQSAFSPDPRSAPSKVAPPLQLLLGSQPEHQSQSNPAPQAVPSDGRTHISVKERNTKGRKTAAFPVGAAIAGGAILLTISGWGLAYLSGMNDQSSGKRNPVVAAATTSIPTSAPASALQAANTSNATTSAPDAAGGGKEDWSKHYKEAVSAFDESNYARAEVLLRLASNEARHAGGKANLLLTLRKLEDALYVQQKFNDADNLNHEIHRLMQAGSTSDGAMKEDGAATASSSDVAGVTPAQADRVAELAMVCHKKGQCDTAISLLEHAVEISKKMYGPRSLKTADRMSELASLYLALEEPDKAHALMKQVFDIKSQKKQKAN